MQVLTDRLSALELQGKGADSSKSPWRDRPAPTPAPRTPKPQAPPRPPRRRLAPTYFACPEEAPAPRLSEPTYTVPEEPITPTPTQPPPLASPSMMPPAVQRQPEWQPEPLEVPMPTLQQPVRDRQAPAFECQVPQWPFGPPATTSKGGLGREHVSVAQFNRNPVHLPKFSGKESLQGFLNQIDNAAEMGNWPEAYKAG